MQIFFNLVVFIIVSNQLRKDFWYMLLKKLCWLWEIALNHFLTFSLNEFIFSLHSFCRLWLNFVEVGMLGLFFKKKLEHYLVLVLTIQYKLFKYTYFLSCSRIVLKTALGHRAEIFTEFISTVLKRLSLLFLFCICLLWKGSVVFVAIFV